MCTELGKYCSSAAMVFAMHQIQVACIVEHCQGRPHFDDFLTEIAVAGRLIASATTEAGTGGDVRSSVCAVESDGQSSRSKRGSGDLLRRIRRRHARDRAVAPTSATSDQVLVHVAARTSPSSRPRPGTRSAAWHLQHRLPAARAGIRRSDRSDAVRRSRGAQCSRSRTSRGRLLAGHRGGRAERARVFVRVAARKTPGFGSGRRASSGRGARLDRRIRALVDASVREFVFSKDDPDLASSMAWRCT